MATKKATRDSLVDKVVLLGSSLAYLTKGATDQLIDVLDKNKVISTKEGKQAVEHVRAHLEARRTHVQKKVVAELGKVIDQLGLATKKDLEKLKKSSSKTKKSK